MGCALTKNQKNLNLNSKRKRGEESRTRPATLRADRGKFIINLKLLKLRNRFEKELETIYEKDISSEESLSL